jgi:VWFA-related protein
MKHFRLLFSLGLALSIIGSPGLGQNSAPDQAPTAPVFYHQIEVHILNIDVAVADKKGNPIYGLTKDDFSVTMDGKAVEIENFYVSEPAMQQPEATAPPAEAAAAAPAPQTGVAQTVPQEQRLHLAVVIDTQRLLPAERNRVIKDLGAQLQKGLRPGDEILVAAYNGGLQVRQPFTSQWQQVVDNLDELTGQVSGGMGAEQERRNILRDLTQASGPAPSGGLGGPVSTAQDEASQILSAIQLYARQASLQTKQTVSALNAFVDGLGGLPGRKALLLVTTGMEEHPGRALLDAWNNKYSQFARALGVSATDVATGDESTTDMFKDLIARANAKRVTFYSIGTAGAGVSQAVSAGQGGGYESAGGAGVWSQGVDAGYRADMGAPLSMIASDTGGRALVNSSNYDQLVQWVRQDASSYYSLGIRAPEGADTTKRASHQIRVHVDVPDVDVRYRREAAIRSENDKASDRTLAELMYGNGDNPLAIAADFGPSQPHEQGKKDELVQPILVKIPFVKLTLLPQPRFHEGKVTIFVVARDDEGRVSSVQSLEAPIRIPNDKLMAALKGVGGYRIGLLIRPGPHQIAIGVRDEIGNTTSTIRLQHDVQAVSGSS